MAWSRAALCAPFESDTDDPTLLIAALFYTFSTQTYFPLTSNSSAPPFLIHNFILAMLFSTIRAGLLLLASTATLVSLSLWSSPSASRVAPQLTKSTRFSSESYYGGSWAVFPKVAISLSPVLAVSVETHISSDVNASSGSFSQPLILPSIAGPQGIIIISAISIAFKRQVLAESGDIEWRRKSQNSRSTVHALPRQVLDSVVVVYPALLSLCLS